MYWNDLGGRKTFSDINDQEIDTINIYNLKNTKKKQCSKKMNIIAKKLMILMMMNPILIIKNFHILQMVVHNNNFY